MTTAGATATRRILQHWDAADDSTRLAGEVWYGVAREHCREVADASGVPLERVAIVMAHLSPRCSWSVNVRALRALLIRGERLANIPSSSYARAARALEASDPWSTFGPTANKTRSFARNILGDRDTVTCDSWAARAAGVDELKVFGSAAAYRALEGSYRSAARRRNVAPSVMQATVWAVVRGRA